MEWEPQQAKKIYLRSPSKNIMWYKKECFNYPPFPFYKPSVVKQLHYELFLPLCPQIAGLENEDKITCIAFFSVPKNFSPTATKHADKAQSFPKACGQISLGFLLSKMATQVPVAQLWQWCINQTSQHPGPAGFPPSPEGEQPPTPKHTHIH